MKQEIHWLEFWFNLTEHNPKLLPVTVHGTRYETREGLEQRLKELKK
jgi:hypothetical protein